MTSPNVLSLIAEPLSSAAQRFASQIPRFAAAFFLLLLGMFTARALRALTEKILAKANLDGLTSRVGINEVLARLGFGKSPSFAASFLIYWFVLFIFIVSAANAVDMGIISDLLERFVAFLPALTAALLIFFGGLLFARFLSEIVSNATAANGIKGGAQLSQAAYVLSVAFSTLKSLEQMGVRMDFVSTAVQILLASAGLAIAIAFGLGGKDAAAEIIRDFLAKRRP